MLDANKIYVWTIIIGLLLIVPGIKFLTFLDELTVVFFSCIALLDCCINHCWRKYKLLWIVTSIIGLYAVYSATYLSNNSLPYILMDWLIQVKPFVPFAVLLSAGIHFTAIEKTIIEKICIVNCIIISLLLFAGVCYFGNEFFKATIVHITYTGQIIFICTLFYLYCKLDNNGNIDRLTMRTIIIFLTIGLLCGRSKYFAIYVCTIPFLIFYKPGFTRHLSTKQFVGIGAILCLMLAVTWHKFNYYFLVGNSGGTQIDPTVMESFARPVLYVTGYLILFDYFPFGSGLASFATYPSQANYSNVYFEYGINNVWGLSPSMPDFICDAYYPSLAQFGIIGLILFIYFWIYAYGFVRRMIRSNIAEFHYKIVISALCVIFILIENSSGNTFTFSTGAFIMALLGISASPGYFLKESSRSELSESYKIKI